MDLLNRVDPEVAAVLPGLTTSPDDPRREPGHPSLARG